MGNRVQGKVALVTGASSGIGREAAILLAQEGAVVMLAARREKEGQETVRLIEEIGGKAQFFRCDVSREDDVRNLVESCVQIFGCLDCAVNCASIEGKIAPITDLTEADWDEVQAVNVKGIFFSMKYEAKAMLRQQKGGAIVNVGSVNSFLGYGTGSAYTTSKHAQLGITRCAAAELGPSGIRVNMVCPGVIMTPMHERLRALIGDEAYDTFIKTRTHYRRKGSPQEIATNILWLCSDEASYISGTYLIADGGLMATF